MAKTISFVKGKGSLRHDNRDFIASNIDELRVAWNVTYIRQEIEDAYELQFGRAVEEYNQRQKRTDRKIDNYLEKIKHSGNNEKQFYETVVQIGKRDDTGVLDEDGNISEEAKRAKEVLDEYARTFQERNPNLYLFNAVLHMDEATPHLHLDYIPIAHGYKSGLETRNSLTKALQEMGIAPATGKADTETMHWQARERAYIETLCREKGIEIEVLGVERDDYSISEYKAAMRAKEEAEAELEILKSERTEQESILESVDSKLIAGKEQIESQQEILSDINERISEAEEKCKAEEARIDRILNAGEPTRKEVEQFKREAKPVMLSLPGEGEYVKLPKTSFEKLLRRYQAVGTLQKMTEDYEKRLKSKDTLIQKLREQVKGLKDLIAGHEEFLSLKGLLESFKEFIRPKKLVEQLMEKKEEIERSRGSRKKRDVEKNDGQYL